MLAAPLHFGCTTAHLNVHDDSLDYLHITRGHLEYHLKNGKIEDEYFPIESPVDIRDGIPTTYKVGIAKELEIGWDITGLKVRPMAMIRLFYVGDFGGAIGGDENAFISGIDWRYRDVVIGPIIGIPWLDPSKTIYGGKIAIPLSF